MKKKMKLVEIGPYDENFTLNRVYVVEFTNYGGTVFLFSDNGEKQFGLSLTRFVEATEEEYHAQRGIRQTELFNL